MSYLDSIITHSEDAEQLEQLYQGARNKGETAAFKEAIEDIHTESPENLLFAAWFHRLKYTANQAKSFAIGWVWVVPLAVVNGLLFWWLSDFARFTIEITAFNQRTTYDALPAIALWAAPLSAAFVLAYLTAVSRRDWRVSGLIAVFLLAAGAYVLFAFPQVGTRPFQEQYLTLMAIHLPLLAWAGVGWFLMRENHEPADRFAFLIKSLEIFIMGGLFVIAGGLFTVITAGLFSALNIDFPELVMRLFIAGGGGLIPVVATAIIYNPTAPPSEQSFDEGLSKLIGLLMRIILPLTLLVLLVYTAFIPFNFREPFNNRDVLIIYNAMLFAVIALLVGATPVSLADVSPRLAKWLRLAITAVAALAFLVSIYALAAILYRTGIDRLTPNRLTFIGWNVINIVLLFALLFFQARAGKGDWLQGLFRAYSMGTVAYSAWTIIIILGLPGFFNISQGDLSYLPEQIQRLVFEEADPILLKCPTSPHIYLLEGGEKRWINNIETFTERGYVWRDVEYVSCNNLRAIPDGVPIPEDAGPPPVP